ncbi:MAG: dihydrofolate reductase [Candidatus Peribacteraceae bacterium]|nr:dihydrofolate reductase [Candidatus Peribacteraceae bacterium]MDD5742272.1 dihydrofolate reductase [Candidatus Peribacteraceae bacterium]
MKLSMIVAVAENGAIGARNQLLWDLPRDMKHFRETTSGHAVIMGQRTFESIGRPLPKRLNIVVTQNPTLQIAGCTVVHSPEEAIEAARSAGEAEAFVIGGGMIYKTMLPMVDRVYFTRVHVAPEADSFFPPFPTSEWKEVNREECAADAENKYAMDFLVYERRA